MSNQRIKLSKKVGQRSLFAGTVKEFTHKKIRGGGKGPVLLLTDIEEVDKRGKAIETDLTDHVWINATGEVFALGQEMFPGDTIMFSAIVKPYSITRKDVLNKRQGVINQAREKNQRTFANYREDYLDWKDDWQNVVQANQAARQQMQQGKIDRATFQSIEQQNIQNYKDSQPNGVAVKNKEINAQAQAQRTARSYKLVDYEFDKINQVKFINQRRLHQGWQRLKFSKKDIKNIHFTKYLAARSFAYRDGVPFDVFDKK